MSNTLPKFIPITINMPTNIKSVFDINNDIYFNTNIDYPKCSFGFNHYIHSIRNKDGEVLKQFENKKKIYNVNCPFELKIDNYNNSIYDEFKKFFKLKDTDIITTQTTILWEILFMFDLINIDSNTIISSHNNSGMGQAYLLFRDTYSKTNLADKDIIIMPTNNIFSIYKNDSRINNTKSNKSNKFDLITITTNQDDIILDKTMQEQEYFIELLNNICNSILNQKTGGCFIIKIYETFTNVSSKILALLINLYEKVFIVKPYTSKPYLTEKFIVCINYNNKYTKNIQTLLDELNKKRNNNLNIVDLITGYKLSNDLLFKIIMMNKICIEQQYKSLGSIISYVNSQNYYGEIYQQKRNEQIEAATFWTDLFLPTKDKFKDNKKIINNISFMTNKINVDRTIDISHKLIL